MVKSACWSQGEQRNSPDSPGVTLTAVDLAGKFVVKSIPLSSTDFIAGMAMTPLGDDLFIATSRFSQGSEAAVQYLPIHKSRFDGSMLKAMR
jgi:hypothetical protein